MDSKRTSRRDLLKGGAAAAGGLAALGQTQAAAQLSPYGTPVHDQMPNMAMSDNMPMVTPDKTPMIKGTKDLIEYGQRSHYVTSMRMPHPMGGRPSPEATAPQRAISPRTTTTARRSEGITLCAPS